MSEAVYVIVYRSADDGQIRLRVGRRDGALTFADRRRAAAFAREDFALRDAAWKVVKVEGLV